MVPVVVRDQKGHAVGTFKKEDFQLFDKGKPQFISKFTIERADGKVVPAEVPATDPGVNKDPAKSAEAREAPPPPTRFVVYLFDDMHINFGELSRVRAGAVKYLSESMQPIDRVAIYTTSGQQTLDFTDDRAKIEEMMNKIQPRSRQENSSLQCPEMTDYVADLVINKNDPTAVKMEMAAYTACSGDGPPPPPPGAGDGPPPPPPGSPSRFPIDTVARQVLNFAEADLQMTMSTVTATVRRMTAMPGLRAIVLVSPGFLVTEGYRTQEMDAMDVAIRSNVTINTLDARGLYATIPGGDASSSGSGNAAAVAAKAKYDTEAALVQSGILGEFADGTGGTAFDSNNDLSEGFRRTGATPEYTYLLGFSPENLKFDGKYHVLKVTLKDKKGVTLTARRGYYAPNHARDPKEDAKEDIREAVFSRDELSDIPVELRTQFSKVNHQNAKLSVLAHVNLEHLRFKKTPDGRHQNTLSIVSAVFDRNGILVSATQKDIDLRFKDETFETRIGEGISMKTSFDVTPGSYVVRLVVRDSEGQTMAARNAVVDIP